MTRRTQRLLEAFAGLTCLGLSPIFARVTYLLWRTVSTMTGLTQTEMVFQGIFWALGTSTCFIGAAAYFYFAARGTND